MTPGQMRGEGIVPNISQDPPHEYFWLIMDVIKNYNDSPLNHKKYFYYPCCYLFALADRYYRNLEHGKNTS